MKRVLKLLLRDEGFTYIEVFISILLLSLISSIIYINSNTITGVFTQGKTELLQKYDILRLQLTLKTEAEKVKTPWFLKNHIIEEDLGYVEIFYYKADITSSLKFTYSGDGLYITSGDITIFSSEYLTGDIKIEGSFIIYTQGQIILSFPLGVLIA